MQQAPSFDEHAPGEPISITIVPVATATVPAAERVAGKWAMRSFDVAIALVALFLLGPLMCFVALLVAIDGGPVLFRRPRTGFGGRTFGCLQFRTTIDDADASYSEYLAYNPAAGSEWTSGPEQRFDPRVTTIGRILHASGMDELPQLLNILRGDMSLFGSRPADVPEVAPPGPVEPRVIGASTGLLGGRPGLDLYAWLDRDGRSGHLEPQSNNLRLSARPFGTTLRHGRTL